LKAVEKSLKIFQAMDGIAVARRCADLTQEIFEVAKMSVEAQQRQRIERNNQTPSLTYSLTRSDSVTNNSTTEGTGGGNDVTSIVIPQADTLQNNGTGMWGGMDDFSMETSALEEDFFASLIDPKILDSFGANLMGGDFMDQSFFTGFDFGQGFAV
jgi:hypothetical protein